jgi:hypothetical protein
MDERESHCREQSVPILFVAQVLADTLCGEAVRQA